MIKLRTKIFCWRQLLSFEVVLWRHSKRAFLLSFAQFYISRQVTKSVKFLSNWHMSQIFFGCCKLKLLDTSQFQKISFEFLINICTHNMNLYQQISGFFKEIVLYLGGAFLAIFDKNMVKFRISLMITPQGWQSSGWRGTSINTRKTCKNLRRTFWRFKNE